MKGTLTSTKIIPQKIEEYLIKIYSQIMNLNDYISQFNNFELKDFKFLHFGKVNKLNLNSTRKEEEYKNYKIENLKKIFEEWNKKDFYSFLNEFQKKEIQYFNREVFLKKKIF